jgi:CBS domain-containing protein
MTGGSPGVPNEEHRERRGPLQVSDIMSRGAITAGPDDTMASAARKMSEHNVSCVVVVDGGQVVGVLTEKDVLKGVAGRDIEFHRLRVSQRMSSPVESVPPDLSALEAGRIMNARNIRRLPVVQDGQLVGIVTETDITRGLVSLNPVRYISDIMTPHVPEVDTGARVDEAARVMSHQGISCVIARHRQEVAGIVTEKDVLRRVVALHKDPTQTPVVEIMSFPVVAVPPTYSILSASRRMEVLHIHRLIVMDERRVHGVVTQTDILRAIRGAFEVVESQRWEIAAQFADLMRNMVRDMEKAQQFLSQIQIQKPEGGSSMPAQRAGNPAEAGAYCIL